MYLEINNREDLIRKESEIKTLFQATFGHELSLADWRWFYVDNPAGPALVSLFYENDRLLGHYAVVPTKLTFRGESFIAYRSMTTMVHPDAQGRGLFTEMAKRVFSILIDRKDTLVYGFPNTNSAPGFVKHLDWVLPPADRVIDFRGDEILKDIRLIDALTKSGDIEWDMQDAAQSAWRNAKPGAHIVAFPGLLSKLHDGILNVLHISKTGLTHIQPDSTYRVLMPADFNPKAMQMRAAFSYQFGFRVFNPCFESALFRRELIMSDVF